MPNVHLGPHFERFVAAKLEEGRYQNASEVIRAGLRLLEDAEAAAAERRAAMREELSGRAADARPMLPAGDVFDALRAHHKAREEADRRGA